MSSEARSSPRYARQLDVNIDGLEIVTTNVAIGGVQLCCPEIRYPGFQRAQSNGELNLGIAIPGAQTSVRFRSRLRYANLCDDEYLIGLQFTAVEANGGQLWAAYIDSLARARLSA